MLDDLLTKVTSEEAVQVPAFGTFEVKKRLERIIISPSNGKRMLIPPKLVMSFRPTTALKDRIQKGGSDDE